MSIRQVIVHLDVDGYDPGVIELARDFCERFDASLIGLAACDLEPSLIAANGVIVDPTFAADERDRIEQRLKEIERDFHARVAGSGGAEWRAFTHTPTEILAHQARAADMIIVEALHGAGVGNYRRSVDIGELLANAGRPVTVAAHGATRLNADRVVIGWKDTREARRSVRDALPILERAEEVLVATLGDLEDKTDQESVDDVAAFLSRHGIRAHAKVYKDEGNAGRHLVELANGMGADLVVTGAYGHSRWREWVFGGVTRKLLETQSINRFMSS